MNILIIGNGLDLDLGLPTKYTDFLDFTNAFIFSISNNADEIDEFDTQNVYRAIFSRYHRPESDNLEKQYQKSTSILKKFERCFSSKLINKACKDFYYCVHNNCWLRYFNERYEKNLIAGENWIDLESEIQNVIEKLEDKKVLDVANDKDTIGITTPHFNSDKLNIEEIINSHTKTKPFRREYNQFKNLLLRDFDKFIMALGIYLDFFVSKLSPNINKASIELQNMMTGKTNNSISKVLSFNYINNFQNNAQLECCFVQAILTT